MIEVIAIYDDFDARMSFVPDLVSVIFDSHYGFFFPISLSKNVSIYFRVTALYFPLEFVRTYLLMLLFRCLSQKSFSAVKSL